jgi:hypothetical protein
MGNSIPWELTVLALATPTGTTPKERAISWVITEPLAPVSTIISKRLLPLKVTSTIGVPPIRRLMGTMYTCSWSLVFSVGIFLVAMSGEGDSGMVGVSLTGMGGE